jgi:hypothetical protein
LPRSIFRQRSEQKGKSSSVIRTNILHVGQRRSFADFFFAAMDIVAASGQRSRNMVAREGGGSLPGKLLQEGRGIQGRVTTIDGMSDSFLAKAIS